MDEAWARVRAETEERVRMVYRRDAELRREWGLTEDDFVHEVVIRMLSSGSRELLRRHVEHKIQDTIKYWKAKKRFPRRQRPISRMLEEELTADPGTPKEQRWHMLDLLSAREAVAKAEFANRWVPAAKEGGV